jgi:hypothetical protein
MLLDKEIRFPANMTDITVDNPMLSDIVSISAASRQLLLKRSTVNLTESHPDGMPCFFFESQSKFETFDPFRCFTSGDMIAMNNSHLTAENH